MLSMTKPGSKLLTCHMAALGLSHAGVWAQWAHRAQGRSHFETVDAALTLKAVLAL